MAHLGTVTLPVRLQVGDGDPVDLGEVSVELAVDPTTGDLTSPTVNTHLADVLAAAARTLRKEATDAAAPPR